MTVILLPSLSLANEKKLPIDVLVSAIWEGEHVRGYNLDAMKHFRERYPELRILHFINPAYFSRQGTNSDHLRTVIQSVIKPGDEVGLHLQPWKSLAAASQVVFRRTPTYWGYMLDSRECDKDCGKEVPLIAYPKEDIDKLLAHSLKLMEQNQWKAPKSFLAGGWLASKEIWDSMAQHNLQYDFSAVPPNVLRRRLGNFPLFNWLNFRWLHFTPVTAPYAVQTATAKITEIGTSAAAADFITVDEGAKVFQDFLNHRKRNPDAPLLFHISFHQETAMQYLPRVQLILERIIRLSEKNGTQIRWLELPIDSHSPWIKDSAL